MEPRPIRFFVEACGGRLLAGKPDGMVVGVSTDTRTLAAGELFVALRGDRFDGHEFLELAVCRGAYGVVIDRPEAVPAGFAAAVVQVADSRIALGRMAAVYRAEYDVPVIAVAGSNGKSTTKELLASVLRQGRSVLASPASFNNDIGVPLTLFRLTKEHQVVVVELGTNHPGELAPLVRLAQPRYGVLTNLGHEHLEFFGGLEGVIQEEGWLGELLPAAGALFVPGGCRGVEEVVRRTRARVVRVGSEESNAWRVLAVEPGVGGVRMAVQAPEVGLGGEYDLKLLGRHQVNNALLALAVGASFGLSREQLRHGLAACAALPHRLENWTAGGVHVIDDAYNANADSVVAALETLRDFPCAGRRIAVLGEMAELGEASMGQHGVIGRKAAELGVDQLFAIGNMAAHVGAAARSAGLVRVLELSDVAAAAAALARFVRPGDVVLLKASRKVALERIGEHLRQAAEPGTVSSWTGLGGGRT